MKTIYSGICTCGHTLAHDRPRRLTGEWASGYDGECTGRTKGGDTCHKPIFLTCQDADDVQEAE